MVNREIPNSTEHLLGTSTRPGIFAEREGRNVDLRGPDPESQGLVLQSQH